MSLPVENAGVEVDEDYGTDHDDSSYDSSSQSATTSVGSSVFSFTYENGRRYHSDRFKTGEYFMPNDEKEQDRLDLYHHIFLTMVKGKLHLAPLDNPQHVLDVGTGTGIWAIDMADENPQAEVTATDISPIQPSWVPPNCKFEVDDMEEPWTFDREFFDYIHFRTLSGCFKDWDFILKQSWDHVKPGGWVEFQDYGCEIFDHTGRNLTANSNITRENTPPLAYYFHIVNEASVKLGRPVRIVQTLKGRMEKLGFTKVKEERFVWPLGDWPKDKSLRELGGYSRMGLNDGLQAFGLQLLTRVAGYSVQEVETLVEAAKKDMSKQGGKYYAQGLFVYGQRPKDECD